ncbi:MULTISPECIES: hypothetical protein [Sporosarcina]|uniref:hypothetical protein n=1 Tax=Sporosarcina TaxID=1569 RepID=UPI001E373172|nr:MULTISPECIES: hypothetical protein [Sporosarcina]
MVIGGEGTIREVLNGIIGFEHVTISIMKASIGNDYSRGFSAFHDITEIETYLT